MASTSMHAEELKLHIKNTWPGIVALMLISFRNEGKFLIGCLISGVAKKKKKGD